MLHVMYRSPAGKSYFDRFCDTMDGRKEVLVAARLAIMLGWNVYIGYALYSYMVPVQD